MAEWDRSGWLRHGQLMTGAFDAGAFFGSIVQRLQVRFYSISSSPLMHPKSIHITCAVVYEKTVTGVLAPPRSAHESMTSSHSH